MADVRSLLREQRTLRRISHPHASYSATGTLTCVICRIPIKSDSLWEGHLRSSTHVTRSRQSHDASSAAPTESRKRKASEDEDVADKTKRPKATQPSPAIPKDFFDESAALEAPDEPHTSAATARPPSSEMASHPKRSRSPAPTSQSSHLPSDFFDSSAGAVAVTTSSRTAIDAAAAETVNEDEYAAFEREIAAAATAASNATISAAPVSAAELATRAIAEANVQEKEQANADIEDEQEDAVRRMEIEIDEMEELEERVKRLRNRREELRQRREKVGELAMGNGKNLNDVIPEGGDLDDDEDEDEDGDTFDDWAFRPV